jgi:hypothetical protein
MLHARKKKNHYLIFLSILSVLVSSTTAAEEIVLLEKDQPAPFKGLLFSPEKSNEMYKEFESLSDKIKSLERINALYKENEFLYDRKINTLLEQNTKITDTLIKTENQKQLDRILWFGLGFLSVGLGIYGVKTISGN